MSLFTAATRAVPRQFYRPARAGLGNTYVTLLPMSHLGTPAYYDATIKFITEGLKPEPTFIALEGLTTTRQERNEHNEEFQIIQTDAKARASVLDSIAANDVMTEAGIKATCEELCVPYPLPEGLVLQDAYWKPRLVCHVPQRVHMRLLDLSFEDIREGETMSSCAPMREQFLALGIVHWAKMEVGEEGGHAVVPWGHAHKQEELLENLADMEFEPVKPPLIDAFDFGIPESVMKAIHELYATRAAKPIEA
eukprot:PhM_4_TR9993/c0_g1_i1/m.16231